MFQIIPKYNEQIQTPIDIHHVWIYLFTFL